MCETCDLAPLCSSRRRVRFGDSAIMMGQLTSSRLTICVRERGVELQRIIIARSGLWHLIEFAAAMMAFF